MAIRSLDPTFLQGCCRDWRVREGKPLILLWKYDGITMETTRRLGAVLVRREGAKTRLLEYTRVIVIQKAGVRLEEIRIRTLSPSTLSSLLVVTNAVIDKEKGLEER
jgi:hypothetical protein